MKTAALSVVCLVTLGFAATAFAAGDPERGKLLYESRCFGCHSVDANRIGPAHRDIVGRKAGRVTGYSYSPAVKSSRIIWTEKTLDRWLANPERLIPGQKMGYSVPDRQDRADLIAYLKSVSQH